MMSRTTNYRSRPPSRPPSEQLVDLHVYVVPPDVWRDRFNNFLNQAVIETVSLGIIRVPPEVRLMDLRQELLQQLEDLVPQEYVFLRSVGRSITRLKSKQEYQYKVKHFVRPQAYADELYLLEATPDMQASFTSRSQSPVSSRHAAGSQGGSPRLNRQHGYRPPESYQGYDERYAQPNGGYPAAGPALSNRSQRDPPYQRYSPLPKIPYRAHQQNGDPNPSSNPQHGYPDSSYPSDPYAQSNQRPDPSDSYGQSQQRPDPPDPYSQRRERSPSPSRPYPGYPGAQQPGSDPKGADPYEARAPENVNRAPSRENSLTPVSDGEGGEGQGQSNGHAQSDAGRRSRAPGEGREGQRAHPSPPPPLTERREGGGAKSQRGYDPRAATYTTNTNEDSGVAGLSPDDNFDDLLDRRKKYQSQIDRDKADHEREEELERQRRLRDLEERDTMDRDKWDQDAEERRRRQEEERRRRLQEEAERKRQAEEAERNRRADSDDEDNDDRGNKDRDNKHRRPSSEEAERGPLRRQQEERKAEREDVDPQRGRLPEEAERGPLRRQQQERKAERDDVDSQRGQSSVEAERRPLRRQQEERKAERDDVDPQRGQSSVEAERGPLRRQQQERKAERDDVDSQRGQSSVEAERRPLRRQQEERKAERDDVDSQRGQSSVEAERGPLRRQQEERKAEREDVDPQGGRSPVEELNRFPSPPPVTRTPPAARDTASARQARKIEKEKLLKELEAAKEERKHAEKEREELVRKAKQLQNKTQNRRNHARDVWKKRYFEEKKKTAPLEDQTNRLRAELDTLHRKLMASLEGPKQQKGFSITGRPSQRNNYVIQCTRLQHEIEDLHRRVENAKMKLTAEMKLHTEAEEEAKLLRALLTQKKISLHGHAFSQIY